MDVPAGQKLWFQRRVPRVILLFAVLVNLGVAQGMWRIEWRWSAAMFVLFALSGILGMVMGSRMDRQARHRVRKGE